MCVFVRFLLSIRWYKHWKKYVGFDSWDTLNTGDETYNPGPIDNTSLFKGWLAVSLCLVNCILSSFAHHCIAQSQFLPFPLTFYFVCVGLMIIFSSANYLWGRNLKRWSFSAAVRERERSFNLCVMILYNYII